MAVYTKTINIRSYNLGVEDTTFFLTFDGEETPGLVNGTFPTAWKVIEFPKAGGYMSTTRFKSQFGFTRAELKNNFVLPASTYIPINVRQETTLKSQKKHEDEYMFSMPTHIPKDQMVAKNGTTMKQNFGVGFFNREIKYPPTTLLVFENVGTGSSVRTKPPTLLRGYVVPNIEEGQVLKTKVTTPVLFSEDITKLDDKTFWRITYNKVTETYKIERDIEVPSK